MRWIALAALLPVAAAVSAGGPTPQVFVGSFLSIEEIECESGESVDAGTGVTRIFICMDSLFRARYRVEQVLEGDLNRGSEVSFHIADHYGFPKMAEQKTAVVYLLEEGGEMFHIKYEWNEAVPTSTGDWASCGCEDLRPDLHGDQELADDPRCRPLVFRPPVAVDLRHASAALVARYRDDADYRVSDGWAECVRGVLVEDAFPIWRHELDESLAPSPTEEQHGEAGADAE